MRALHLTFVLALLATPAAAGSQTGATLRVPVRADSRLWLEGSSNVRDWTCSATSMEALIDMDARTMDSQDLQVVARSIRGVNVKVPVRMLKCGDRHMEANMYSALKAPKPPAVSYIIAKFDAVPQIAADGVTMEVAGRMSMAGVERAVQMTVATERMRDGTRRARGSVPILMSDFGITPPRPWMGILRTADKVLVQFEIFVSPTAVATAAPTEN
jgi:polyisoprenoid-binding protein YceI